jgi:hypothetical protein
MDAILDQQHREVAGGDRTDGDQSAHMHQDRAVAFDHDNRRRGFGPLMAGGVSVHFLQEFVHCIELRAEAFPISGFQSLHCLIVSIERLACLICRRACEGYLPCRA